MTPATLRKLEWAAETWTGAWKCPVCGGLKRDGETLDGDEVKAGHAPDCELDVAIREAEQAEKGEPMPALQVGDEVAMVHTVMFRREDAAAGWRPARPLSVKRNGVVLWRQEPPTHD